MTKEAAYAKLDVAANIVRAREDDLELARKVLAAICKEVYPELNDREMAEFIGYSRARVQQFRCGDPRK